MLICIKIILISRPHRPLLKKVEFWQGFAVSEAQPHFLTLWLHGLPLPAPAKIKLSHGDATPVVLPGGTDCTKTRKFAVWLFNTEDTLTSLFQTRVFQRHCSTYKDWAWPPAPKHGLQHSIPNTEQSDLYSSLGPCLEIPFSPQELTGESMRKVGKPRGSSRVPPN